MQQEREVYSELAIHDLQRSLVILGYRLGEEADKGLFGERTAAAVTSFKVSNGLGNDDTVDQATWTALRDASMQLGDRPLYLHITHFRGRDVAELQGALSSMGYACVVDTSFGAETEQALREFQTNMDLKPTGILDTDSLGAMLRLKHIWEGKRGFFLEGRFAALARCAEALESVDVCVFGIDEPTRVIANRVANLARATTIEARLLSVSALETAPKRDMLLVGLRQQDGSCQADTHCISLDDEDLITRLSEAIKSAPANDNRITLLIDNSVGEGEDLSLKRQVTATRILDALCGALSSA